MDGVRAREQDVEDMFHRHLDSIKCIFFCKSRIIFNIITSESPSGISFLAGRRHHEGRDTPVRRPTI